MSPTQAAVLRVLREDTDPLGPPSVRLIAQRLGVSKSAVHNALRALHNSGKVLYYRRRYIAKPT